MRIRLLSLLGALALLATACGGGTDEPSVAVEAEDAVESEPAPTATSIPPTATAVPEPTATPVPPTPVPPTPEPTATPEPEPTAEAEPTAEPAPTAEADADEADADQSGGDTVAVIDGAGLYATNCAGCHGANGEGARAKAITGIGAFFTEDASPLVNLVANGGTNMPAFGSKLTPEEIDAVVAYVVDTFV